MANQLEIPTNELNIKYTKDGTVYNYGLNIVLCQDFLPYVLPSPGQRRLSSALDFVVYGDTVTIDGYLANPGKDIRIYARKIIFKNGAFLDTAGPDPDSATDYTPGTPANQTDEKFGATGAAGAPGSNGKPAGKVVLMAESLEGTAGISPGALRIDSYDHRQLVTDIYNSWFATVKQRADLDPIALLNSTYPVEFGTFTVSELHCSGLKNMVLDYVCWNSQQTLLQFSIPNPSITGTGAYNSQYFAVPSCSFPVTFSSPKITFVMDWRIDMPKKTVTLGKTAIIFKLSTYYDLGSLDIVKQSFIKPGLQSIADSLSQNIETQLRERLQQVITTFPATALLGATPDLSIFSRGGRGGRGQDGHAGVRGDIGAKGNDSSRSPGYSIPPDSIGGKGATGGQGGNAGQSGLGGLGGTVNLGFITPPLLTIKYDNFGGDGGPNAIPGPGGPGGEGGPPGTYLVMGDQWRTKRIPSKQGPTGDPGPAASFQGATGGQGTVGIYSVNSPAAPGGDAAKPLTYDALAPFMKVEQLLITQRAAEFAFLNAVDVKDYQYVLTLAKWLVQITAPVVKSGFTNPQWDSHDIDMAKSIHDNAVTMIANCQQGLDFYGNHSNWAPILTLESYQKRIDQLIALGSIIEQQYRAYQKESATADEKIAALDQAREKIKADIQNDQTEVSNLDDQIKQMNSLIDDLAAQLDHQQLIITVDETIFREEVRKRAEEEADCTFGNIIKSVTNIVQLVNNKGPLDALSKAYALYGDISGYVATYNNALTKIELVDANLAALKKGINDVKQAVHSPSERALVATDKQKFDEFIKAFIDKISAAQALKDAVDHYFDLIDSRNQTICSYNALYLKRAKLLANVDQTSSQIQKVDGMRQLNIKDPALPSYTSFMENSYNQLKTVIVKKLYEENRALWYWSLKETPFSTTDLNMATLAATHVNLSNSIDTVKERKVSPFQKFSQKVPIIAGDYPLAFRALPDTKKLIFSIPVSIPSFLNHYQVIADDFKLEFPDLKGATGVLYLTMIHPGNSYQLPNTGSPAVQFVHLPRVVPYNIDYSDPANTSGGQIGSKEEGFIGLGPFTTWCLNFDHPGNNFVDSKKSNYFKLESIQTIVITFEGTYMGPLTVD